MYAIRSYYGAPDLVPSVPLAVSIEYGADINILRLHDLKHGARYVNTELAPDACDIAASPPNGGPSCLANRALEQHEPVVCQGCHYTPALDLAQVGPVSGAPNITDSYNFV